MKAWNLWPERYYKNMKSGFESKLKKLCAWVVEQKKRDVILKDQKCCIRECGEFKYLGVKIDEKAIKLY